MSKVIDINKYKENLGAYEEMELKIVEAKGYLEIEEYKKQVEKLIEEVSSLSLFKGIMDDMMADQIRYFLIEEILDNFIKKIFINEKPDFILEKDFIRIREEMFENLKKCYGNKI